MGDRSVNTNSVRQTSAVLCVDTIFAITTIRHKIVAKLRDTSTKIDIIAVVGQAVVIVAVVLAFYSPLTIGFAEGAAAPTNTAAVFSGIIAAVTNVSIYEVIGGVIVCGSAVCGAEFSINYYKDVMTKSLNEDYKQLHKLNVQLQALTSVRDISDAVKIYTIETSHLARLYDPVDCKRRIKDLILFNAHFIITMFRVVRFNLPGEIRYVAEDVSGHFPGLQQLNDSLPKLSERYQF